MSIVQHVESAIAPHVCGAPQARMVTLGTFKLNLLPSGPSLFSHLIPSPSMSQPGGGIPLNTLAHNARDLEHGPLTGME